MWNGAATANAYVGDGDAGGDAGDDDGVNRVGKKGKKMHG